MRCIFYSSPEKTKSRVTFFFPTPLNQLGWCGVQSWTDKAHSMCTMSEQHWRGAILQSDLCSVENLSQIIIVFLVRRCVLHGDTHNHYKSRSRMKVECGRKERKHVVTESGRVADCKWMAIGAKCNAWDQVYHFPCPFPSNSLSPSHFGPILLHRWVAAGKPFTEVSGWFVITREHNSFSPPSRLAKFVVQEIAQWQIKHSFSFSFR